MREDKQSKSIIVIIVTPGYLHETFCHNVCWHKLPAVFWWKQGPRGLKLHKVVTPSNSARFQPSRIFLKPLQMSPCQMGCGHMGDTDWPRSSRARLASQGRQSETTRICFTFWKSFNATWFTLTSLLLWYVCKKTFFFFNLWVHALSIKRQVVSWSQVCWWSVINPTTAWPPHDSVQSSRTVACKSR